MQFLSACSSVLAHAWIRTDFDMGVNLVDHIHVTDDKITSWLTASLLDGIMLSCIMHAYFLF